VEERDVLDAGSMSEAAPEAAPPAAPDPTAEPVPGPTPAAPEHTITGDVRSHTGFHSRYLAVDHDIVVWLPPGYEEDAQRRFPVLYLQDGQNLFDDATSFAGEWHVDETAQALVTAGEIEPLIIVGISNAGAYRLEEYTPTRDMARKAGGRADAYGRMMVEELKPFIDHTYRTHRDAAHTGLGGSSLGGLVSMYLGLKYSGVFWRLAIFSPSVWWDNRFIIRRVRALSFKPPLRIWLSMGTAEGPEGVDAARRLRDALVHKGWRAERDLSYHEIEGAPHSESAWAGIVDPMLRFLFPAAPGGANLQGNVKG
jgi:predicted alpha/beta superfamily hydrolase